MTFQGTNFSQCILKPRKESRALEHWITPPRSAVMSYHEQALIRKLARDPTDLTTRNALISATLAAYPKCTETFPLIPNECHLSSARRLHITRPASSQIDSPFFRLPLELRQKIYDFAGWRGRTVHLDLYCPGYAYAPEPRKKGKEGYTSETAWKRWCGVCEHEVESKGMMGAVDGAERQWIDPCRDVRWYFDKKDVEGVRGLGVVGWWGSCRRALEETYGPLATSSTISLKTVPLASYAPLFLPPALTGSLTRLDVHAKLDTPRLFPGDTREIPDVPSGSSGWVDSEREWIAVLFCAGAAFPNLKRLRAYLYPNRGGWFYLPRDAQKNSRLAKEALEGLVTPLARIREGLGQGAEVSLVVPKLLYGALEIGVEVEREPERKGRWFRADGGVGVVNGNEDDEESEEGKAKRERQRMLVHY
ncbi:hypothetical protein K461DRAFT_45332 [Myriangium duriaei CBS 260.36]|uniref:Uncharacterized protein n=1 Tax=Myriangium duriaei CBS 260.36 TaxID=1168546 RepID=A0A9P4ITG4_9PEZI|nr:hypothetical protein K461DRAFT_45332 [Myriangium duriaei CBS 260.36]